MPAAVISASPRTVVSPNVSAMRFSGWPSKRRRNVSDQSTRKPQLAGASGATATPRSASSGSPIAGRAEPRPACPAERQNRGVGGDGLLLVGCGEQQPPVYRPSRASGGECGTRRPQRASWASQARSSGDAFMATGNTRPLVPTKVGWPSASHQARTASGGKASMAGRSVLLRSAVARRESARYPRYG